MSAYRDYQKAMEDRESIYKSVTREEGRLKIGPSGKDGLYLSDTGSNPSNIISLITEDEAQFICRSLMDIYGFRCVVD